MSQALAEAAARDADDDWVRVMGAAADGCDGRLHLEPMLERFSLVLFTPKQILSSSLARASTL